MKSYKKLLIFGLVVLFIGASITISVTSQINTINTKIPKSTLSDRSWSDNFDSYTLGQFLDGTPDDGGWKGWDSDPSFGAYVVGDQFLSSPHSVEIEYDADLIHEYYGYTLGQWTYTAWVYVPGDFVGNSYYMLLSDYEDGQGAANKWQFVMRFDADQGIVESENDGNSLPLITDQWVEIRTEIDLDTDWFELYYDGDLLVEREWTAGWDGAFDGFLKIDAVDLFASGASEIYYDDMTLTGTIPIPELCCQGSLSWNNQPGATVTGSFEVSNCGDDGSELNWEVNSWPAWGSGWTFTPASGTGLTPAGSPVTVQVEFTAPSDQDMEFQGNITVINSDIPEVECLIPVYLKTPKNKNLQNAFFPRILEKYPNAFPIIRQLLGL
jgi:hypothetical protein